MPILRHAGRFMFKVYYAETTTFDGLRTRPKFFSNRLTQYVARLMRSATFVEPFGAIYSSKMPRARHPPGIGFSSKQLFDLKSSYRALKTDCLHEPNLLALIG